MRFEFLSPEHNELFNKRGFIVTPFLSEAHLSQLRDLFYSSVDAGMSGMACTNCFKSDDFNQKVYDATFEAFHAGLKPVLKSYQVFGGPFVIKSNVDSHEMKLHQDWTFADEDSVDSAFIWCPLVDTTPSNGGMFAIDGSHQLFRTIRPGNAGYYTIFDSSQINDLLTHLTIPAGHALIMKHGLFHGSNPNLSDELRPVVMGTVLAADSQLIYYSKQDEPGKIKKYHADHRIFINGIREILEGKIPDCLDFVEELDDPSEEITLDILRTRLKKLNGQALNGESKRIGLRSAAAQAALEKDGFVKVPFLNEAEFSQLKALYETYAPEEVTGFYVGIAQNEPSTNHTISEKISSILEPALYRTFWDLDTFAESFMVKSNTQAKQLRLHQDWSNVDERKHNSVVLWCPLQDVDQENGALFFIKGSHKYLNNVRSGTLPTAEIEADDWFTPYLTPVEMKAGEICIFNPSVFHGSYDNTSDQPRVVLFACGKSQTHPLVYFQKGEEEGKAVLFEIPTSTFLEESYQLGSGVNPSKGKAVGIIDYDHYIPEDHELKALVEQHLGNRHATPEPEPQLATIEQGAEEQPVSWFRKIRKKVLGV